MKFRSLIGGLGLLGILSLPNRVEGQDRDTGYQEKTRTEILELLTHRAVVLNDSNFQQEILDYDGAAIVLFYSSCAQTENTVNINKNMEIVYLQLMDKFPQSSVNNLPLKFTSYDGCKYVAETGKVLYDRKVTGTETHMYLDGREIDRMRGGPISEETIPNSVIADSAWIESNLLRKPYIKNGQEMKVVYNGALSVTLVPYINDY